MRHLTPGLGDWLDDFRAPEVRRLILYVYIVDASFGLLFMVALQSYLDVQRLAGLSLPGLALALFAAGKLSTQYIASTLTDRAGPRAGLLAGLGAYAVSLIAFLFGLHAAALLLIASFIYGVGSATVWPALLAQAGQIGLERRARLTGAMSAATGCGLASALVVGFVLPTGFPFWPIALVDLVVIGGLLLATLVHPGLRSPEPHPDDRVRHEGASGRTPAVIGVGAIFFLQATAGSALLSVFRSLGQEILHVSLRWQIAMFMPAFAAVAIGVLIAGLVGHRTSRPTILSLASAGAALALLGLAESHTAVVSLGLLYAGAMALGLALPTTTAAALDAAGGRSAAAFGLILTFEGVGHIVGPAVSAVLVDVRLVLAFVAMLMFLGCCGALALRAVSQFKWQPATAEVGNAS